MNETIIASTIKCCVYSVYWGYVNNINSKRVWYEYCGTLAEFLHDEDYA